MARDELRADLTRFATRDELHEELARFATRDEPGSLREDLRRHMDVLYEGLKSTMHTLFDGLAGRIETLDARVGALDARVGGCFDEYERRITGLEARAVARRRRRRH